jgi:protein arginine kinase
LIFRENGPWTDEENPDADVVVTSRARLARNLTGFPFVNQATESQRWEIVQLLKSLQLQSHSGDELVWVDMAQASARDRQLLYERHLVSRQFVENELPRAVAVGDEESLSLMVNEEDHLRMQVLLPGLRLNEAFERVCEIDRNIESVADIAVHPRWGYLTACPTNLGTACRFGVMLHLPGLRLTNEMERVRRAAKDLHLAVRGFHGEGSESSGDFYQVSNQVTLGMTETDLLDEFLNRVVPQIVEYERASRQMLISRNEPLLDDRVHRALGTMRTARLLGIEEAMKLLSRIRLGIALGRICDVRMSTIQRLFLQLQPAHLHQRLPEVMQSPGKKGNLVEDDANLRQLRADEAREALQ